MTNIEPILVQMVGESSADENWSEAHYCDFLIEYHDELTPANLTHYLFIGEDADLLTGAVALVALRLAGCDELRSGDESRWAKLRGFAEQSDYPELASMAEWALSVLDEETYHLEQLWSVLLFVYDLYCPDVEQLRLF
jgi:hypothetical protein